VLLAHAFGDDRVTPPRAAARFAPKPQDPADVAQEALEALGRAPVVITGRANRVASFFMRRVFTRRLAVVTIGGAMRKRYD
jgi:hypothetical protein